ncbi:MAG TPA: MFS transporter [Candidatus Synoicihabitans sp.]|nr:MFS transporter [Candidatus Synoicihabitans sp.]
MAASLAAPTTPPPRTALVVILALSGSHLLNDVIQAVVPAIYPLLKERYRLNFTEVGLITLVFQGVASLLQPVIGLVADRRPLPHSLALGMAATLIGLVVLAFSPNFAVLLLAAALIGLGSAVFHPEASRLARLASGGRHGFAQSLFQVGGNFGTALGPLLAALIVMPRGQTHVLWFTALAFLAIVVLNRVGQWYRRHLEELRVQRVVNASPPPLRRRRVMQAMLVLVTLVFSKYVYLTSFTSFYTFYLIERFDQSAQNAQLLLFLFLFAVAAGTLVGGPIGDRFGRRVVIWFSILGVAPFALLLPHVGLVGTAALTVVIGLVLASAFSAILVYAQELVPGRVGLVAGLFFGLAFGIAGIGSVVLGRLADHTSIDHVFRLCSGAPLLGLATVFLPRPEQR